MTASKGPLLCTYSRTAGNGLSFVDAEFLFSLLIQSGVWPSHLDASNEISSSKVLVFVYCGVIWKKNAEESWEARTNAANSR